MLGKEHLDTLTSVNNLASDLWSQGRYEEAEALDRRVLNRREKVIGKEHPDTLTSVSNLVSDLRAQGKSVNEISGTGPASHPGQANPQGGPLGP